MTAQLDLLPEDDALPEDHEHQSLVGLMYRLVPCEWITLATVDPVTRQHRSRSWPGATPNRLDTAGIPLSEKGDGHPVLRWARRHPRTLEPWRVSSSHGYSLLVVPLSAEPSRLAAWLLTRSAGEFGLLELEVARLIAPGLRQRWSPAQRPMDSVTGRELEVLRLIAAGLTATAVARRCQISARTVHKHLENAYAKLGCHDRLSAVLILQDAGLLGRRAELR
jgi:DNA-binding CsgD family transcriptional regulator